jgi:hypothetical protein
MSGPSDRLSHDRSCRCPCGGNSIYDRLKPSTINVYFQTDLLQTLHDAQCENVHNELERQ